ncbi:conserved hypothetical protein [Tenacibaculum sp. 190524A05c]|uniref:DUF4349 domain-containing protein n=1 Tax=Tenacibaculum platacis TaxID=3137852 RepID=UPI0031FAAC5E
MKVYLNEIQIRILIALMLFLGFISCNQSSEYKENISVSEVYDISNALPSKDVKTDGNKNRITPNNKIDQLKIIKSGTLKLKVKDVKETTKRIKVITGKFNAYVANLKYVNNSYQKENNFKIKVPKEYFDVLLDSISAYADVIDQETVNTQDVTEQFVDVSSRLETKLQVKERYENVLRKKAKTVEDIIYAEEKLGSIQEEIEAAQGKLKYLSNRVAFSFIDVILYEEIKFKDEIVKRDTFWTKSKEGLLFGLGLLENLVLVLVHSWSILVLILVGILLYRKRKRA